MDALNVKAQLGVLAGQFRRLEFKAVHRSPDLQHLAGQIFVDLLVDSCRSVPAGVAGTLQRHAVGAPAGRHDPGVKYPPARVLHADDLPGPQPQRGGLCGRDAHGAGCVLNALHLRIQRLRDRPQRGVGAGCQQQIALDGQRVGARLIGGENHPDVVTALPDLDLVDCLTGIILIGQRSVVVRRDAVRVGGRSGQQIVLFGVLQQRAGGIRQQRRRRRALPGPDDDVAPVRIPRKFKRAVGVGAQKAPGRLRHPGQQLPPGQVVRVKRLHLVAAVGGQRRVGDRHAAARSHGLRKRPQAHGELPLDAAQPGGLDAVQPADRIIGIDLIGVAAVFGRLDGAEDADLFPAARGVQPVTGHLGAGGDAQRVARLHPQLDLQLAGAGRARGKVGVVRDRLRIAQAADRVVTHLPAADFRSIRQHKQMLWHGVAHLLKTPGSSAACPARRRFSGAAALRHS